MMADAMTDWQLLAGLLLCFANLVMLWRLRIIERKVERLTAELSAIRATVGMDTYAQEVMKGHPVFFWRG